MKPSDVGAKLIAAILAAGLALEATAAAAQPPPPPPGYYSAPPSGYGPPPGYPPQYGSPPQGYPSQAYPGQSYSQQGAPAFYYGGPPVYAGPGWYNPWFYDGGVWVYRPYRYWYWTHETYWRPGWRPGPWDYHYRRY